MMRILWVKNEKKYYDIKKLVAENERFKSLSGTRVCSLHLMRGLQRKLKALHGYRQAECSG